MSLSPVHLAAQDRCSQHERLKSIYKNGPKVGFLGILYMYFKDLKKVLFDAFLRVLFAFVLLATGRVVSPSICSLLHK